jgi:small subunit ribosomal protein S20
MANHASAKKRARRTERRKSVNHARLGGLRTSLKKMEEAIESGDKAQAEEAFQDVQPKLMRGAQKGVIHRNQAARRLSRLSGRIKKIAS